MLMNQSLLREHRLKAGLSQVELAARAGTTQPSINRLETGQTQLTKKWAERLAPHLGIDPKQLLFGAESDKVKNVQRLRVVGTAAAGVWRDITLYEANEDAQELTIATDERFYHARQYALHIVGDSMNLLFPDGSYVTCVDFAESGLALKPGMIVHVERRQGHLIETTVKAISATGRKLEPRSTNTAHKPLTMNGDDSTEIVVRGIVTGSWNPINI